MCIVFSPFFLSCTSQKLWTCWILKSNICCYFLQAGAVKKSKKRSISPNRWAAENIITFLTILSGEKYLGCIFSSPLFEKGNKMCRVLTHCIFTFFSFVYLRKTLTLFRYSVPGSSSIWTCRILKIEYLLLYLQADPVEKSKQMFKIRHVQINELPRTLLMNSPHVFTNFL